MKDKSKNINIVLFVIGLILVILSFTAPYLEYSKLFFIKNQIESEGSTNAKYIIAIIGLALMAMYFYEHSDKSKSSKFKIFGHELTVPGGSFIIVIIAFAALIHAWTNDNSKEQKTISAILTELKKHENTYFKETLSALDTKNRARSPGT